MHFTLHGHGFGGGRRCDPDRGRGRGTASDSGFLDWMAEARGSRGRGGGGGSGRGRRMFDSGELRLVLLKLIVDQPRHGYDLIREIETMTGGDYAPSPGVVYPTLTLLDEMGLIEEQRSEGAKKRFAATNDGRRHLEDRQEQVDALIARIESMGGQRQRWGGSPVWRAVSNLGTAMRLRIARGDMSDDTMHDIAAMIDDLAQKIERLR